MLLNLSVASLVLSQMSHSPAFAGSGNRYHLSKLQYFKQVSPLVYGYRSLLVEKSKFRQFTSSLIVAGEHIYTSSSLLADEARDCPKVDCSISQSDGTLYQCEVRNACGGIPQYPTGSGYTDFILDVSNSGPTTITITECAFVGLTYSIVKIGQTTTAVSIDGSCISEMTPAANPLLIGGEVYPKTPFTFAASIRATSVYQCTAPKGVYDLSFQGSSTNKITITLERDNMSYNTQKGNGALFKISGTTRESTTSFTQCWIMHNDAYAVISAEASNSGSGTTTLTNCFFHNTTISESTGNALFRVYEQTWKVDTCYFDENSQSTNKMFAFPAPDLVQSVTVMNCKISIRYGGAFITSSITSGKTIQTSGNTEVSDNIINMVPSFTMNEFLYKTYSDFCKIYYFPATAPFTPSQSFTPTPYVPTPDGGGGGGAKPTTVHIVFAVLTSAGTALVAFGIGALVFLCFRGCCIYSSANYLKIDI